VEIPQSSSLARVGSNRGCCTAELKRAVCSWQDLRDRGGRNRKLKSARHRWALAVLAANSPSMPLSRAGADQQGRETAPQLAVIEPGASHCPPGADAPPAAAGAAPSGSWPPA